MKTSTILKTLSAIGIFGTAVFSINANAEGGCPAGSVPQQGQGWQSCVPTGGGNSGSGTQWKYTANPAVLEESEMAVVVDTKTDKVYNQLTTHNYNSSTYQNLMAKCQNAGGNCKAIYKYNFSRCMTVYKHPRTQTVRGRGLFAKSQTVTATDYTATEWSSQAERDRLIKSQNGTPIKDFCPN